MQLVLHPASAKQQNSGLLDDASDLHYIAQTMQNNVLISITMYFIEKHVHCIVKLWVVHCKTLWHYIALQNKGGGSLQNVYKGVVHCKWVLPRRNNFPRLHAAFSAQPTNSSSSSSPAHCTVIGEGPRVFHTKLSPRLLSDNVQTSSHSKTNFASPLCSFRLVTMHALLLPWTHWFEIWPLHGIKTSRLRPVCKGFNVQIWPW